MTDRTAELIDVENRPVTLEEIATVLAGTSARFKREALKARTPYFSAYKLAKADWYSRASDLLLQAAEEGS